MSSTAILMSSTAISLYDCHLAGAGEGAKAKPKPKGKAPVHQQGEEQEEDGSDETEVDEEEEEEKEPRMPKPARLTGSSLKRGFLDTNSPQHWSFTKNKGSARGARVRVNLC